ncbi:hypothetical protein GCM10010129_54530 [Streptomyces fumigatiscleroticus]|nr:hypothetical protein GCM10010129_54530 [Streptomyces fumigatiscleroticus]
MPAEVLTARVSAVTDARAATRRVRIRRLLGCGCMYDLPRHGSRTVTDCTPVITLGGAVRGRALGEADRE